MTTGPATRPPRRPRRSGRLAVLVLPLLAGCTIGPDFRRPPPPPVAAYTAPADPPRGAAAAPVAMPGAGADGRWWTAFGSPALDALVDEAIARNAGLDAADATLAASREQLAAERGGALPQVDANARLERQRVNLAAFGFPGPSPELTLYSVGGGVSYDLDLFGGRRRRIERAGAEAEAALRQAEAAHLTLAGQVVNQVLLIAAIRARIATADALLGEGQRNVDLTERRRRAGAGTLVEVLNAQSQLANDRAAIPQLGQQLAEARHLLATLLGRAPADLGATDFDLDRLILPARIPVTLPSDLVHKRPDILEAEARLHAATAGIGVATARLYPDVTLGATVAQGSPRLEDALSASFRGFDIFAGLTAPIFHGGTLKAERRAAIDRARAADATYRQTVLDAFRQVADLLQALDSDARSVANQQAAVDVAGRSLRLSRRSFEVGNSGILQVLDSDRLFQQATSSLVEARARQMLNVARLYVATAGGWTGASPPNATVATP